MVAVKFLVNAAGREITLYVMLAGPTPDEGENVMSSE
jgi:hypothetical protein